MARLMQDSIASIVGRDGNKVFTGQDVFDKGRQGRIRPAFDENAVKLRRSQNSTEISRR